MTLPSLGRTRICLVRHGETAWNAERRIQGSIDIDLNETGRRQAELAAEALTGIEADAIYSSDLLRAWNTARAIAARLDREPIAVQGMRERNYGVLEGMTPEEAKVAHPVAYESFRLRDPHYEFETGESLLTMLDRVSASLEQIASAHVGRTIIVVLHGGVLDIINRYVRKSPLHTRRDFDIPNAGLNWLSRSDVGWRIDAWADTSHLNAFLDEVIDSQS